MSRLMESDRMIGESPAFLRMQEQLSMVAPLDKPVLIIGERGTGKELVAARLHYLSKRWDQNFLKINCAAFTDSLLESQLFGHEAGAFTGATKLQKGVFERADQGSLFLDELATTPLSVQEKILRVTEYGEIERLGGNKPLEIDVRLIAATNVDLPALARTGKFREDLLDRLAFAVITLPPLRERLEDIPVLAQHFAIHMSQELERDIFAGFSKTSAKALLNYSWPGNIRELKNVVERAVYQNEEPGKPIKNIVFDPFESPWRPQPTRETAQDAAQESTQTVATTSTVAAPTQANFKQLVQEYEISLLKQSLEKNQFNQKTTANDLGLSYDQLRGYLRKYKL